MDRSIFIGVRREDKSFWERRTPLPPQTCKEIMDAHPQIQIVVQPSSKRIFTDIQYEKVGCVLKEDLTCCKLIVCIKEIPPEKFIPNMSYIFWSHTIKAQDQNMAMLDKMLELKVQQFDYEKINDEHGVNITAFPYAGIAGVISFLSEYGKWLLKRGINNPFLSIGPSYQYYKIETAYKQLHEVGGLIKELGLSEEMNLPIVIGVLGSNGRCGQGSMQALSNLPIQLVEPDQLKSIVEDKNNPAHQYTIYVCAFKTKDLVRLSKDYDAVVDPKHYYEHPHQYSPIFHQKYLRYLTLIINDIYWDHKFPRYVTNTQMKELVQNGKSRLQGVSDVTCDIEGSIQFLKKYTSPDDPIYFYNPIDETMNDEWIPNKPQIMYMGIDFLPSQLPYDASIHFGRLLKTIIPQIAYSDPTQPLPQQGLPKYLELAVITTHGDYTPNFHYIKGLREVNQKMKQQQNYQPKKALKKVPSYLAVKIVGHLFDTGAINKILDLVESSDVKFNLLDVKVGTSDDFSTAVIQVFSKNPGTLQDTLGKIQDIADAHKVEVILD